MTQQQKKDRAAARLVALSNFFKERREGVFIGPEGVKWILKTLDEVEKVIAMTPATRALLEHLRASS